MSLVERLGYPADARLLIISCENLGAYHSATVGCYESLRSGAATSASLMVPAPWAREAVREYRGSDVGVHLTLNAEFDCYRWRSITHAPTLHSGEGGFPRDVADLWEHADTDEVRRECRAQIERAIVWGFDPTHLDSHLDALVLRPELFDIYIDLALEFALPIRLTDPVIEADAGFPLRQLAADEGILSPDRSLRLTGESPREAFQQLIAELEPGVTEICLQPALDTPELRAVTSAADLRSAELELLVNDDDVHREIAAQATLISYDALRTAQRAVS